MPYAPGNRPPYTELTLGQIRQIHDQVYFGGWRGSSPTDEDICRAQRQLAEFIELLVGEAGAHPPDDQRAYLDKTLTAFRDTKTRQGSELFKAMNDALSYGHRLLNFLLRGRGEGNHTSRDFAQYHMFASDGDE